MASTRRDMTALLALALSGSALAATATYAIPTTAPTGAAALDPAPVGISYVFLERLS